MTTTLRSVRSLLFSVAVLLAGHGLQLTLLPLKARELGWSSSAIGLTGSAYYMGFIIGCLTITRVIRQVGHIRAFAVAISVASVALLAASLSESYPLWLAARLLTGWSLAGLYTVIESWLNDQADNSRRGSLLAIYTIISLAAMVLGQLVIELDALTLDDLFPVATMLIMGATLPVALTRRAQPGVPAEVHFNWAIAYRASHVGLIAAGLSGLAMGMLWSLGAVYASDQTGTVESGARFIMAAIIGGLLFQFPMGRLSDRFDRRWIILVLGLLGALGSCIWVIGEFTEERLYLTAFLCGAAAMPMYSISVAHANDNAEGRFLQIASGMLMANAVGAMLGPAVYGASRWAGLEQGFMIILCAAFVLCVLWTALRLKSHTVRRDHFEPFQPLPKTSLEVITLDPRLEAGSDQAKASRAAPVGED